MVKKFIDIYIVMSNEELVIKGAAAPVLIFLTGAAALLITNY